MIDIKVQISGLERRRRSIGLLHIVAGFFLIANVGQVYRLLAQKGVFALIPLILIGAVSILYGLFRKRWDPSSKHNFRLRLLQAIVFLGYAASILFSGYGGKSLGLFLWVAIALLLAFSEGIALQEGKVTFTNAGFSFPAGYRKKEVAWNAVSDLTLRPDFLTIHYNDNRFLQFELAQPLTEEAIRKVQNFCRSRIKSADNAGKA